MIKSSATKLVSFITISLVTLLLSQCSTTKGLSYRHPEVKARNKLIEQEVYEKNVFIARRYVIEGACFWGYLRRPTQPWERSLLVAMNESLLQTPDRIPFGETLNGKKYGYDNNYEYRIEGNYTGKYIYDSKIGIKVLEFKPTKITLMSTDNGWLFHPNEAYNPKKHTLVP